jgi:hypothetical protein
MSPEESVSTWNVGAGDAAVFACVSVCTPSENDHEDGVTSVKAGRLSARGSAKLIEPEMESLVVYGEVASVNKLPVYSYVAAFADVKKANDESRQKAQVAFCDLRFICLPSLLVITGA